GQGDELRYGRHIVRPQIDADGHAEGDEDPEGGGDGGQDPWDEGPDGDSQGHGEQRIGHGNDPLNIKGLKPGGENIFGGAPPTDQNREGGPPGDGSQEGPRHFGPEPLPPGHALGPGQVVGAVLELLGQQ